MPHMPKQHRPRTVKGLSHDRRPSSAKRGYGWRWQLLRRAVLREHIWCVDPLGHHKEDGRSLVVAGLVDHIAPLNGGGTNDATNLQCLCASCHSRKTVLYDGGFGRAKRCMDLKQSESVNDDG